MCVLVFLITMTKKITMTLKALFETKTILKQGKKISCVLVNQHFYYSFPLICVYVHVKFYVKKKTIPVFLHTDLCRTSLHFQQVHFLYLPLTFLSLHTLGTQYSPIPTSSQEISLPPPALTHDEPKAFPVL